ncbi:MAG TPA: DUF3500 domain-containing protein [Fimbriiglobus sp.]|jgi:hypothetical protein
MTETVRPSPSTSTRGGLKAFALFGVLLFVGVALYAAPSPQPAPVVTAEESKEKKTPATAAAAAKAFLNALNAKQNEKAVYEFASSKKPNWSNLPVSFVPRNGVRLGDLNKDQRDKAMAVVAAVLSKEGYQKVLDIMGGDQMLADNQGGGGRGGRGGRGGGPMFGKDLYYLAIFGTPSETQPWMVQFGGHHLGINVTVVGKTFVLTPTHTGAQPSRYKRGNEEVRPLGRESDAAYKLMDALDAKQRATAIIGQRPQSELLLGPGRDGKTIEPKGIKGSALTKDQRVLLLEVIAAWVNIVEPDAAATRLAAIKEKLDDTYFAWSGPTEKGKAAYFRIQGPAVVIEYAPQNGTDHIHTVIRNPEDDYGAGLMKR